MPIIQLNWWEKAGLAVGGLTLLLICGYLASPKTSENQMLLDSKRKSREANISKKRVEDRLKTLLSEADHFKDVGFSERAVSNYTEAIELLESDSDYGPTHLYVAYVNYTLSLLYKSMKKYKEAESGMLRTIYIYESLINSGMWKYYGRPLETFRENYADALATLSDMYVDVDFLEKAEMPLQEAMKQVEMKANLLLKEKQASSRKEIEKRIERERAILTDNLCRLRWKQGRFQEAELHGKEAVLMLLFQYGPLHSVTVRSMMRLNQIFVDQGKRKEAEHVWKNLIFKMENLNYPYLVHLIQFVATLYFNSDRFEEAIEMYRKALFIHKQYRESRTSVIKSMTSEKEKVRELVNENFTSLEVLNDLALCLLLIDRFEDVEATCRQLNKTLIKITAENETSNDPSVGDAQLLVSLVPKTISKFLKSLECRFAPAFLDTEISSDSSTLLSMEKNNSRDHIHYELVVQLRKSLDTNASNSNNNISNSTKIGEISASDSDCSPSLLVVWFENPEAEHCLERLEGNRNFYATHIIESTKEPIIRLVSSDFERRCLLPMNKKLVYLVVVEIFQDLEQKILLGKHIQFCSIR